MARHSSGGELREGPAVYGLSAFGGEAREADNPCPEWVARRGVRSN